MAKPGDVVDEDLGRSAGVARRISPPSVVARTVSELVQPGESFTAVGCRHPGRIRILDIAKPHGRSQKKARQSNAWPLSFDIKSTWLEREPLWVVLDQRLVIPLRRPRHTNSPQAAAGDGCDGRESAVRPRLESGCRD